MDQRDDELDAILNPLRGNGPTDLEMRRWQSAVKAEEASPPKKILWQLLVACLIGAILGLAGARIIHYEHPICIPSQNQELVNEDPGVNATFQLSYVKLD
jgi:hypothetical protein